MSQSAFFIAGDWGTSNLRLYLCERENGETRVKETRTGPGIKTADGDFEDVLFSLLGDWANVAQDAPVILSGMIGSTLGWREAPYLDCPANAANVAAGRLEFSARGRNIGIVAGLKCTNPLGLPDVMRGEELQLLGKIEVDGAVGEQLVALPGTHNKWALLADDRIEHFTTSLTGELFATLREHSVLIQGNAGAEFDEGAFTEGVRAAISARAAGALHTLFATRSRQVLGDLSADHAEAFLSGLLIGADAAGALAIYRDERSAPSPVQLIGEPALCQRYQLALDLLGVDSRASDAATLSVAGYGAVYEHWTQRNQT